MDESAHRHGKVDIAFEEYPSATDRDVVLRAAAVLEEYLRNAPSRHQVDIQAIRASRNGRSRGNGEADDSGVPPMSEQEALDVLGLDHGVGETEISETHRRLVQMVHPDHGGSHYLTVKLNQAKDTLLRIAAERARASAAETPRRRPRRRPPRRAPT